eukprot:c21351_g1_i1.p1 GENE.c21351_g1_i1~~c21351_g1_i1.p1  ORF type:complete len:165 (+),score=24.19 c21351_g1_i1:423-917(+)
MMFLKKLKNGYETEASVLKKLVGERYNLINKYVFIISCNIDSGSISLENATGNHWITAELIIPKQQVIIWDSHKIRCQYHAETFRNIEDCYRILVKNKTEKLTLQVNHFKQKNNGSDCGVFSFLTAIILLASKNPDSHDLFLDLQQTRQNLAQAISTGCFDLKI